MGSFLSKILSLFVGPDDENADTHPHTQEETVTEAPAQPEIETEPVQEQQPPEGGYWWEDLQVPEEESLEFEEIDTEKLFAGIAFKLAKGEIALIEIPDNIMDVIRLLDSEEFDYGQVADRIEHSPVLVGEFLKAANSAQYNRGAKITNIKVILPRLGRTAVKSILYLSTSKMSLPSHELFRKVAGEIVEHCMVVGRIAEYLSQHYYPDPNKAFLAGLMHDIGKVAILKEISENLNLPETLDFEYSESLFGSIFPELHPAAGTLIADHWNLDEEINRAIGHHHDDQFVGEEEGALDFNLAALINLSDTIARMLGFGRPLPDAKLFASPAAQALRIEESAETFAFFQGLMELFEVDAEEATE